MSFGAADEVDDTMMNILAQRVAPAPFGDDDDDEMFDMPSMALGEYFLSKGKRTNGRDDTVDLAVDGDVDGEYTEALKRMESPTLDLHSIPLQPVKRKPLKQQRYTTRHPFSCSLYFTLFCFVVILGRVLTSRLSAHGVPVPSLPRDLIRNLASQFSSKPLTKDVLPALELATYEFFKNIASDPHPDH